MKKFGMMTAAALMAGALALTGCSSSGSSSAGGDNAGAADSLNTQPRDALQQGGTLKIAISKLPSDNWNLLHIDGNLVDNNNISGYTGVSNWDFNAAGDFTPNKNFVESYDVKGGENGEPQVITLNLNPKAKWNDGTPITVKDYQANWVAMREAEGEFQNATDDGWNTVESVEPGESDTQVVVTLKQTNPDWSAFLSTVLPAAGVKDPETFNKAWAGAQNFHNEWRTGPFKIEKVDEAQKVITMVPNENWWGDKPLLDKIEMRQLDAAAMCNSFANKEVDVVQYLISASEYDACSKRADGEIRTAGGLQWRHFTLNWKGNLADKAVRQAVLLATNREEITNSDLAGLPVDAKKLQLNNHFFMPDQDGYEPNGSEWSYNPDKAKQILDEAGWKLPEGKDVREKDGKALEIEYLMMPDVPTSKNEGEFLQKNLKDVGIKLNIRNISGDDFFAKGVAPGNFEICSFTWQGTQYPMNNVGQIYGKGSNSNYSNGSVPEIDELKNKISAEMDHKKRVEMTNEVDKLIWENVFNIPIYQRMEMTAVPKNIANMGAFGLASARVENIGYMK